MSGFSNHHHSQKMENPSLGIVSDLEPVKASDPFSIPVLLKSETSVEYISNRFLCKYVKICKCIEACSKPPSVVFSEDMNFYVESPALKNPYYLMRKELYESFAALENEIYYRVLPNIILFRSSSFIYDHSTFKRVLRSCKRDVLNAGISFFVLESIYAWYSESMRFLNYVSSKDKWEGSIRGEYENKIEQALAVFVLQPTLRDYIVKDEFLKEKLSRSNKIQEARGTSSASWFGKTWMFISRFTNVAGTVVASYQQKNDCKTQNYDKDLHLFYKQEGVKPEKESQINTLLRAFERMNKEFEEIEWVPGFTCNIYICETVKKILFNPLERARIIIKYIMKEDFDNDFVVFSRRYFSSFPSLIKAIGDRILNDNIPKEYYVPDNVEYHVPNLKAAFKQIIGCINYGRWNNWAWLYLYISVVKSGNQPRTITWCIDFFIKKLRERNICNIEDLIKDNRLSTKMFMYAVVICRFSAVYYRPGTRKSQLAPESDKEKYIEDTEMPSRSTMYSEKAFPLWIEKSKNSKELPYPW